MTITVERQGDMFCATKTDSEGGFALGFGDTAEEAVTVALSKALMYPCGDEACCAY